MPTLPKDEFKARVRCVLGKSERCMRSTSYVCEMCGSCRVPRSCIRRFRGGISAGRRPGLPRHLPARRRQLNLFSQLIIEVHRQRARLHTGGATEGKGRPRREAYVPDFPAHCAEQSPTPPPTPRYSGLRANSDRHMLGMEEVVGERAP